MSSAETTHPIEWRDDGQGGQEAFVGDEMVARIWPSIRHVGQWAIGRPRFAHPVFYQPTASAARSFVEKSVKEAGQ